MRPAPDAEETKTVAYPPGPPIPALLQGLLYIRNRAQMLPPLRQRYGDVFSVQVPPFADNLVVFTRPEHIKEIFAGDPRDLHAGEGNQILGPIMGQHSVLTTDEGEHARARRLLMPAFNGAALRGYRDLVAEIAAAEVDRWRPGSTVITLDRMNALTLEVIMRVVFGVTDERTRAALAPRLGRIVTIGPLQYIGLMKPALQKYPPWQSFHGNMAAIDDLLYAEIAARRTAPDLAERTDVLSRLLQAGGDFDDEPPLTDAELRDQLITLLLAGHETTAAALSWALYELAVDPEVQREAHQAVRAEDDKSLEAVMKEAMRMRTVIPGAVRKLTRDMTIGGWDLPAGTVVACSILLAHRSPQNYPDTWTFRPSRFLDGEVEPNTWLPFGGGVRRCIGAGFSLMEGTTVLREILSRYRLDAPAGAKPERGKVRNITTVPRGKARILVTPR
ncbi:cytochrome P450 [Nocardia sp. NPDC005998]|uniref:cytochrome P450 n=1 Tax=Nocardia sp. NPDC005998 TaxID=3156894 RepID=UPI0033A22A72